MHHAGRYHEQARDTARSDENGETRVVHEGAHVQLDLELPRERAEARGVNET